MRQSQQREVADHFIPLMKECFKDSDVAQIYGAARTKTTCIINRAIAPYLHDELVKKMRNKPYTLSTDGSNDTVEKQAPFKRLSKHFEDPMAEVHLLLYQATLPVFTEFNLLFQCQEPSVYLLHGQMRSYVKKLMSKFVTTTAIKNADVCEVEYKDKQNQMAAVDYAFKKQPFKEPVLEHSQFIDFQQKMDCDVNDALYFVYRYAS
ncbi:hypothetical protein EOD39_7096 [Acipenser ruthenus]|uniref:Uncharacterized protein n=1 Tax=Acipenser ruthenus TaxID=7906 RepID=A0A662YYV9_ACIRT|nr:hypothetical protein EOD39_7096 [Acipenser ruthenus]